MKNSFNLLLFLLLGLSTVAPSATFSQALTEPSISTDGTVYATKRDGNTLYVGGNFNNAGYYTGSGALLQSNDDRPQAPLPYINNDIYTAISDENGGWYVGGRFTQVSGIARQYLAHILPDGTVDPNFDPSPNDFVYTLALSNDSLYVGGEFTSIAGQTHNYLAALNAVTGVNFGWTADANGFVRALEVDNNFVYAGGDFTMISGRNQLRFAKLDRMTGASIITTSTNGSVRAIEPGPGSTTYIGGSFWAGGFYTGKSAILSTSFDVPTTNHPFIDGVVLTSLPDGSGGWYVGGDFNNAGGIPRANLAHILSDGSIDPNFDPSPNNDINAMFLEGNTLYLGGQFTIIGSQTRNRLAAVDITSGNTTNWNPDANGIVYALSLEGNDIYAGGSFTKIGDRPQLRFARLDKTSGQLKLSISMNTSVYAIEATSTDVFLGGAFSNAGFYTGGGAKTTTSSSTPTIDFPYFDNDIETAVSDGSGGWYIGGRFNQIQIGTQDYDYLLHVLPNGTIDPNFHPLPSSWVNALALDGNTLYVGGNFTSIAGQTRNRLAAIDITTGTALTWDPDANSYINDLIVEGNNVYVGGAFTQMSGQNRDYIASIDKSTGTLNTWNPDANGHIQSLAFQSGTIYAGGNFSIIGGQSRGRIAAIDATTGNATSWDPNGNNVVYDITIEGSSLYAGGSFTNIGGQPRNRIAEIDLTTGNASTWNPNCNNIVRTLATDGTNVYFGGQFTLVGAQPRDYGAAADIATGAVLTTWNPNCNSFIYEIALSGTDMILGGAFQYLGYESRTRILSIEGSTQLITSWDPSPNWDVYDFLIEGSNIYVAGRFTSIGGQPRTNLAEIELSTGLATTWAPNPDDDVNSLVSDGTNLYFGGDFSMVDGQIRNHLAAVEIATGNVITTWDPNVNTSVEFVGLNGTTLFVGGIFDYLSYFTRGDLLSLNTGTGKITNWDAGPNNDVYALKQEGNLMYVGGRFTNIGGQVRNKVAAIDLTTAQATTWNPDPNHDVLALESDGTSIFMGGYFTQVDGQDRKYLAAVESATGNLVPSWDPNPQWYVTHLVFDSNDLFVGGQFDFMDYRPRQDLMAINLENNTLTDWIPGSNGSVYSIDVSPGAVFVGGTFSQVGGQPRNRIAALDKFTGNASLWNPDANSTVNVVKVDGATIYAGGNFTQIGGQNRSYLASTDISGNANSWNPDMNSAVNDIVISGEEVYVGGNFTTVSGGGTPRTYLASFERTTGELTDWDPMSNSFVQSLFATNATIYAGGSFSQIGGEDRSRIAAISKTTGRPRSWNPGANGTVYDIHVVSNQVFYGGNFSIGGGQTVSDFAAVDANTGISTRWYPQFNSTVYSIATFDSTLYAGGAFTQVDGVPRTYLGSFTFPSETFKAKLESITPNVAGNTGDATVTIFGAGFGDGTTVRLTKAGEPDIVVPDSLLGIIDGIRMIGQFDLRNVNTGFWALEVETSDTVMTLVNAFEIVEGEEPEIIVDLVGFDAIRPNQWQTYIISYKNKGNVDAKGVPLFLALPEDADVEFGFSIIPPLDTNASIFDTIPLYRPVDSIHGTPFKGHVYSFIIPVVPANSSGTLSFQIKTQAQGELEMAVWAYPPMFGSPLKYLVGECIDDLIGAVAGVYPGVGCVQLVMDAAISPIFDFFLDPEFSFDGSSTYVASYQYSLIKNTWSCLSGGISSGWTLGAYALDFFFTLETSVTTGVKCAKALAPIIPEIKKIAIIAAIDPNDKTGLLGGIQTSESIPYLIRFENLKTATAPAQTVIIEDTLDTDVYDLSTFELGFISVGNRIINVPPSRQALITDVDLRPLQNLILHIEATLDTVTGLARWEFTSLDPSTLEQTMDPFAGFLPPNVNAPEGEGSVFFTIRTKEGIPTGTEISNKAYIYFDSNPVIPTDPWANTVDDIKPQSAVNGLANTSATPNFTVDWSGSDVGSGIKSYDIYVSINNSEYIPWLVNIKSTSAIFTGQNDSTYSFYSQAIDSAGNVEDVPNGADATTSVLVGIEDEIPAIFWSFQVFPNPNAGTFQIKIENPQAEHIHAKLIDMQGREILTRTFSQTSQTETVTVSDLSDGIYLLQMRLGTEVRMQRVMIKH